MVESNSESKPDHDGDGFSIKSTIVRGLIFAGALIVLVVGGLFALSAVKDSVHYYQVVDGCDSGDAEACYDLARHYCRGNSVARDDWKCQSILESNCVDGHARSCMHAGWNYIQTRPDEPVEHLDRARKACQDGDLRGCHVTALVWETQGNAPDDAEAPEVLLERACEGGLVASCDRWLSVLRRRDASDSTLLHAAEVGCKAGFEPACLEQGARLLEQPDRAGEGARMLETRCPTEFAACAGLVDYHRETLDDPEGAEALAKTLCHLGVNRGCKQWSDFLEETDDVDEEVVRSLRDYACDGRPEVGCDRREPDVDFHRERCSPTTPFSCAVYARKLARNEVEDYSAEDYLSALGAACDGGLWSSCSLLSFYLRDSVERADEMRRARQRACEHGIESACIDFMGPKFQDYPSSPKPNDVIAWMEPRCESGDWKACENLGGWYAHALEVWWPATEYQLAEHYGALACEMGSGRGCAAAGFARIDELSTRYLPDDVERKQSERFARACELGFEKGCLQHGLFYIWGPNPRDEARGRRILEDYCRDDHPWICFELVDYYQQGELVEKNPKRAREILKGLCNAGSDEACGELDATSAQTPPPDPD